MTLVMLAIVPFTRLEMKVFNYQAQKGWMMQIIIVQKVIEQLTGDLWSKEPLYRIRTRLPQLELRSDGSTYSTGTEWADPRRNDKLT